MYNHVTSEKVKGENINTVMCMPSAELRYAYRIDEDWRHDIAVV